MIFSKEIFKKVPTTEMYKSQMNGLGDKSLNDFNPITLSCAFIAEKKKKVQQKNL